MLDDGSVAVIASMIVGMIGLLITALFSRGKDDSNK